MNTRKIEGDSDPRYAGELEHGELEGDPDSRHAVEHPLPAGDGELEHGELEHGELDGDPDSRHAVEHPLPAGDGELEMDSRTMRKVIALVLTILEIESWENSVDN
jgi:hypothetical protein